jgi:hypothetical protein
LATLELFKLWGQSLKGGCDDPQMKAALLAGGIGLSMAGFAGSQPAAAQSHSDGYACPAGYVYDPAYGCTLPGDADQLYDFGYYGYLPYGTYGSYYGGHRGFGHGLGPGMARGANHTAGIPRLGGDFGNGMAGGFDHDPGVPTMTGGFGHRSGVARFGHGFAHGVGGGFDHGVGFAHVGGFGHGMAGGFHGGGGGHR